LDYYCPLSGKGDGATTQRVFKKSTIKEQAK
jgi:hypothetical protein